MFFFYPSEENATLLALDNYITKDNLNDLIRSERLTCTVGGMKAIFTVDSSSAEYVYKLLLTGFCKLGFPDRPVYKIVPPVIVEDTAYHKIEKDGFLVLVASLTQIEDNNGYTDNYKK